MANAGDGLIVGALTGYMSQEVTFRNASNTRAQIDGPSVGVFATYFNAGFSADLTLKADLLDLTQDFSELLVFGSGATFLNVGSGSTDLTNYTVQGNVNYRFMLSPVLWLEPTAGFRFLRSDYAANATTIFGLTDADLWRVQGGARIGATYGWGGVIVTPTLTGLAYCDVSIWAACSTAPSVDSCRPPPGS